MIITTRQQSSNWEPWLAWLLRIIVNIDTDRLQRHKYEDEDMVALESKISFKPGDNQDVFST